MFILARSQVLFEHHYFENDVNLDGLSRISRVYVRDVKRSARLVCCDSACLLACNEYRDAAAAAGARTAHNL